MINLQTAVSLITADPFLYNSATYVIVGVLLLVLAFFVLRHRCANPWGAVASLSALSMLPLYHHLFDAKLLLLTVPACALTAAGRKPLGYLAALVTFFAIVATADLPWAIFLSLTHGLHPSAGWASRAFLATEVLPAPLLLLAVAILYLRIYASLTPGRVET